MFSPPSLPLKIKYIFWKSDFILTLVRPDFYDAGNFRGGDYCEETHNFPKIYILMKKIECALISKKVLKYL